MSIYRLDQVSRLLLKLHVTQELSAKLERIIADEDGVSAFTRLNRYEYDISVGEMFDVATVRLRVERHLRWEDEQEQALQRLISLGQKASKFLPEPIRSKFFVGGDSVMDSMLRYLDWHLSEVYRGGGQ